MSLSVRVLTRSGKELCVLQLSSDATTEDLKQAFAKKFPKFYPERQYYTIGADASRVTIAPEKKLSEYGLKGEGTVVFKDLGPQISWKTVFHVEYAGPIIVFVLFYFFPQLFYWGHKIPQHNNYTQNVAFVLVVIHYIKRELETHYIHRFSLATMPLFNIFKNSTHYWIFGGALIAYFQFHPLYTETKPAAFVNVCAVIFLLMEAGNLYSHIILRNLRKPGSRDRGIPRGFLFEYVTCANYTFELAAWLVFAIFTQTLTAYLFFFISAAQICAWSVKKHKALRKEFGDKVPRRKILVPFIW